MRVPPGVDVVVEGGDFGVAGADGWGSRLVLVTAWSFEVAVVTVFKSFPADDATISRGSSSVVLVVVGLEGVKIGDEACEEEAIVAVVETEDRSCDGVEVALPLADSNKDATDRGCIGVEDREGAFEIVKSLASACAFESCDRDGDDGAGAEVAAALISISLALSDCADGTIIDALVLLGPVPTAATGNLDLYSGGGFTLGPTEMAGASADGGGLARFDDRSCLGGGPVSFELVATAAEVPTPFCCRVDDDVEGEVEVDAIGL